MYYKKVLISLSLFLIYAPVFAQTYSGNKEDINKILANIEEFSTHYMNENYDKLAAAYTLDGKILPPGTNIIEGREAIKKRWTLPEDVDIPHHEINPIEIKIVGNHAYDVGYYEGKSKRPDGSISDFKGKYVIVWKKTDGDWKIYLDIWNGIE